MEYKKFMRQAKDEYQNILIDKIADLFLDYGIEKMKMTDIAEHLDLGVATLYRYFKTKKKLVVHCGIHLWEKEITLFEGIFDNDVYINKTGLEQLEDILKIFKVLYEGQPKFLRFLRNFDLFVTQEKIDQSDLQEYESSILNVYPLFKKAYEKGLNDGSINQIVEFDEFYFTVNHSLMSLSQKVLPEGSILESDNRVSASNQIDLLIKMISYYLGG